ncbi:MAG: NYN domain-containing protein [Candidatus Nanopelagicales bacterium]
MKSIAVKKVNFIIDGMNIFHAVKEKFGINFLNIDLNKLVRQISLNDENILSIKFFVSPFVGNTNLAQIQREFIERNSKLSYVDLKLGVFRKRNIKCQKCTNQVVHYQEKHTDINIALEISRSAIDKSIDKIYLITADDDFKPAIASFNQIAPNKKFVRVLPPGRFSASSESYIHLNKSIIKKSQFNDSGAALPMHTSQ